MLGCGNRGQPTNWDIRVAIERPLSESLSRLEPIDHARTNGGNRRILLVAAGCGEGPLTEPTAAARLWEREPLFLPLFGRSQAPTAFGARGWIADLLQSHDGQLPLSEADMFGMPHERRK
jgi:hypothetical protein